MNSKIKIRIYRSIINEVSTEYENTKDFIHNKLNEVCLEHGYLLKRYVYIFLYLLCYVYSLERIFFALK